jgi:hypothetical protein
VLSHSAQPSPPQQQTGLAAKFGGCALDCDKSLGFCSDWPTGARSHNRPRQAGFACSALSCPVRIDPGDWPGQAAERHTLGPRAIAVCTEGGIMRAKAHQRAHCQRIHSKGTPVVIAAARSLDPGLPCFLAAAGPERGGQPLFASAHLSPADVQKGKKKQRA